VAITTVIPKRPAALAIAAEARADPQAFKSRTQCQIKGNWKQTSQLAKEDKGVLHRVNVGARVLITAASFYDHLIDLANAPPTKIRQPARRYQMRPRPRTPQELEGLRSANERGEEARRCREAKAERV
jgi:hypothetical protein